MEVQNVIVLFVKKRIISTEKKSYDSIEENFGKKQLYLKNYITINFIECNENGSLNYKIK